MIRHFINGQFVASSSDATMAKRSPVDGSLATKVAEGGQAEVNAAVTAARNALSDTWGILSQSQRAEILQAVAAGIERRLDEFVAAEVADTGKPVALAREMDIPRSVANFRHAVGLIANVPNELFETPTADGAGALNYTVRRPVGVVAVVSPWNVPLLMLSSKVAPALACGNTVVVKPSEETPRTATLLGEIMSEAGLPPGVYNVVHGRGPSSAGEYLTRHPGVNAIAFTGETRTGATIMKAAAEGARPVLLELGGKCPAIVFADCDIDAAVAGTLRSAFLNCGQICLGTERVYVERPIFERFVAALASGAVALKPGRPEDLGTGIGPLISREHRDKVFSYFEQALKDGATVVCGGGIPPMPDAIADGNWIQPTIWTGLAESSRVLQEEIFGPCCHIAPFDTEEDVIRLANDTPYGLAASVWSSNLARAHRVAAQLAVGVAWVNSWLLRDTRTAFGGVGQSGIGREGGAHSLAFYTETKNICIKL